MPRFTIQSKGSPKVGQGADPRDLSWPVVRLAWDKQSAHPSAGVALLVYDPAKQQPSGTNEDAAAGRLATSAYLNRQDLNNLIRELRKARDQAFGADA